MSFNAIIKAPFAHLGITHDGQNLTGVEYLPKATALQQSRHPLVLQFNEQLQAYFADPTFTFTLPVTFTKGTSLQQQVWRQLQKIPVGQVKTYGEMALKLNTGARVIGNACRANLMPLIFPCHRVVAKNGLGGFAGNTSGEIHDIKSWLLQHEKAR